MRYGVGFVFTHRPWEGFKRGPGAPTGVSGGTGSPRLERVPAWSRSHSVWQPAVCGVAKRFRGVMRRRAATPKTGGAKGAQSASARRAEKEGSNSVVWRMAEKRVTNCWPQGFNGKTTAGRLNSTLRAGWGRVNRETRGLKKAHLLIRITLAPTQSAGFGTHF